MPNSSFSTQLPTLQVAWDSTSLGALKTCPRYYQYSIVEGWAPKRLSVHLTFGLIYHSALERYDHERFAGRSHDEAQRLAVLTALEESWNHVLRRPIPFDDKYKNRFTLVRSIVWYLEQFTHDPIRTVGLANGKPAVELSFRYENGYVSAVTGESYMSCGHIDRLGELNDQIYVVDRKTTKSTINADFFTKFSPDNQFSQYVLATKIVYALPVVGLIVDAAQVAITFSAFQRGFITRNPDQIEEWHHELQYWLRQAESYAVAGYWPMNDKSCGNYGGCQYREICSKSPSTRQMWLEANYTKRVWDPLQVRGDV